MLAKTENLRRNAARYDKEYKLADIDRIVASVRDVHHFLDSAARMGSWAAFFQREFAQQVPGKNILELGSGNGLNALVMAALGANVTAVDISSSAERIIEEATARLPQLAGTINAVTGDFGTLPFPPASLDLFVGRDILHHLTHEVEAEYLTKAASLLKDSGEARFVEPASNSRVLDGLRWILPVPHRPSILCRRAFREWWEKMAHPVRDNSSRHYRCVGEGLFREVEISSFGSIERLHRLLPRGDLSRRFQEWAFRADLRLPRWFRNWAARAQLIVYRFPKREPGPLLKN